MEVIWDVGGDVGRRRGRSSDNSVIARNPQPAIPFSEIPDPLDPSANKQKKSVGNILHACSCIRAFGNIRENRRSRPSRSILDRKTLPLSSPLTITWWRAPSVSNLGPRGLRITTDSNSCQRKYRNVPFSTPSLPEIDSTSTPPMGQSPYARPPRVQERQPGERPLPYRHRTNGRLLRHFRRLHSFFFWLGNSLYSLRPSYSLSSYPSFCFLSFPSPSLSPLWLCFCFSCLPDHEDSFNHLFSLFFV
jgi:hypothetical protein